MARTDRLAKVRKPKVKWMPPPGAPVQTGHRIKSVPPGWPDSRDPASLFSKTDRARLLGCGIATELISGLGEIVVFIIDYKKIHSTPAEIRAALHKVKATIDPL